MNDQCKSKSVVSTSLTTRADGTPKRVAFISTRIAGTDGVSLEIEKWADVIERNGVECYYVAGELDRPDDRCALIEEAHFSHPEIQSISERAFSTELRDPKLTDDITRMTRVIRDKLKAALDKLDVDLIIPENALTIPMNIPLGIAIVQEIQERGIACIAHHHDFYWERERFLTNSVTDILRYAFPPALPHIQHCVINSLAGEQFCRRTGVSCRITPNVMDYANPPPPPDDYSFAFKRDVGLNDDDILVLQPTRVVARKGIEHSIELVQRLQDPRAKLVITHASGDEGDDYAQRIRDFAELMKVQVIFADQFIAEERGLAKDGHRLFTIGDAYHACDLVAYPSLYEGFGNAFLEAIYYKKPVVCNRYAIYQTDIEPMGFNVILFDDYIKQDTVDETKRILEDQAYRDEMVAHNYALANEFFSYEVLEQELFSIMLRPQNVYRLVQRNPRWMKKARLEGEDLV
jgi:glycosyltransferase involved in cell wall biosynthesis